MYYVYILQNGRKDFFYVGMTHELKRRMLEHQEGDVRVTKGYRPLFLVWYCVFPNKFIAAGFEKFLKSGSGRTFFRKRLVSSVAGV